LILLAIDTSAHICAVCVLDTQTDQILAEKSLDIGRGHAEVLMGLIEACLSQADVSYEDLGRIGVTIGPGSFTGVRVGMSVARGFGVSLGIPVIGISTLDACEARARALGYKGELLSLLDAKRGELYCKISKQDAFAASYEVILEKFAGLNLSMCGSGSLILNEKSKQNTSIVHTEAAPKISIVAMLASQKPDPSEPPEPLYLRSADAKVQAGFALERA
jgi:tRNA threonylcarbamoyl adenosine modification protein YeaZ